MLIIRLQRVGRKNDPAFRVVVTQSENAAKSGKFLEILGSYNPRKTASKIILNVERIQYWISKGAKTSDTVNNILVSKKIIEGKKINVSSKKLGKKLKTMVEAKASAEAKKKADEAKAEAEAEAEKAKAEPTSTESSDETKSASVEDSGETQEAPVEVAPESVIEEPVVTEETPIVETPTETVTEEVAETV